MAEGSNIVGLKYVAEGLDSVLAGLRQYQTALKGVGGSATAGTGTARAMDATTAATKRADTEMQKWFRTQRYLVTLMNNSEQAAERKARALEQAALREARAAEMTASKATIAQNRRDAEERRALQNYLRYQREKEQAALREARVAEQAAAQAARAAAQRQREEAQAAAQAAAVQQKVVTTYDNLLDTLNPLAAAQQRYNQQVAAIQAYHQQASSSAEALQADLNALNAAYARAGSPINQFGQVTGVAGTRANTLGLVLQQTGYQVGDFAVQVQSGTNAFVAFGQQATQLAGLLYLIPGGIGVIAGTVASIAIPVITGFLAWLSRTEDASETARDAMQELSSALRNMASSADTAIQPLGDLAERFGASAAQARAFLDVIASVERVRFQRSFAETADALRESFDFGDFTAESLQTLTTAGRAQETILNDLIKRQQQLLREGNTQAALELGNQINESRRVFEQAFGAMATDVGSLAERLGVTTQQANEFAVILARVREAQTFEQKGQAALQLAEYIRQNVAITENLSSAESAAVEKAVQLALAFLEASGSARDLEGGINSAAGAASVLLGRAQAVASAFAAAAANARGVGMRTEAIRAETAALQRGASLAEASATRAATQTRLQLTEELRAQFGGAVPRGAAGRIAAESRRAYQAELEAQRAAAANQAAVRAATPDTGGSSGSGRAAVDEQAEAFERLRRSIDDTYRAQQMFTEGKAILDAQFADKNSAEYLRLLDLLKQKYPEVAGAANDFGSQLQQISNVMSRSMEDAFMSIIDGSQSAGEAFKGMARTIIAEVVKIMVIRPLVRGILGIFGLSANADGGIFSGGSRMAFADGGAFYNGNVTPFADGGVVSSPTLFPMRNGTGLMGEAGPEAIMPLKRTSSGKLGVVAEGGGAPVTVVQNFHIAANGDESVRRIVRDESPRIAEQAKAAVLDAKRRGGAYGRAF